MSYRRRRRSRAIGSWHTIDMPTALHPQTQLTLKFDHQILPRAYGFPIKIRIPTKLGFKNPKYVTAMWVQNNDAGGYWRTRATTGSAVSRAGRTARPPLPWAVGSEVLHLCLING